MGVEPTRTGFAVPRLRPLGYTVQYAADPLVGRYVFQQATGVNPTIAPNAKQLAGRKGGLVGGKKRMDSLTPDQRLELAAKGVAARKKAPASEAGATSIKKISR